MKVNMGKRDRALRAFVAAPALVILGFVAGAGSVLGIVVFVLAAVMLATSAAGFCPLYAPLRINTCGRRVSH